MRLTHRRTSSGAACRDGEKHQVLLGVTGSGKTFTMAKLIEKIGRPALVLAHNKTLAAQLYHEFKSFFPNAVEYFVSYYDYYQPEAYIPSSGVYIEKEATINDELDRLRLSATRSLFERRDCVIVASVSCIYGLGSPEAYYGMLLMLEKGQRITRKEIIVEAGRHPLRPQRHDFKRGTFRVRGDVIEIYPTYDENAYRIEMWGDEVEVALADRSAARPGEADLPAAADLSQDALRDVAADERRGHRFHQAPSWNWWPQLEAQGKLIEAQRLHQRTMFDLEMMKEIGYCHGIENYSRHFSGRLPAKRRPRCSITCRTIP
jgi:excinuclease ABC subunit B